MTQWTEFLEAMIRQVTGPEDEADTNVNGIPGSTTGEEDESGFDEMADWPEESDEDEDEDDC